MLFLVYLVLFWLLLLAIYWFYPKTDLGPITLEYENIPDSPAELEQLIFQKEKKLRGRLKKDNQARIVWQNDSKEKTPYSLVYLHGFSASQFEGYPIHRRIAQKFGMNLYLSRLAGHGLRTKRSFKNLTPDELADSAIDAINIAKKIGHKVILMGTSTGCSLSLMAMANDPEIVGAICFSPNIDIADPKTHLLRRPFGLRVAKFFLGGSYHVKGGPRIVRKYWTSKYRIEGVVALREFLDKTMILETFEKVTQPVLFLAYYKNEKEQDSTVSVAAMETTFGQLGTPESKKVFKKMPNVAAHCLANKHFSKDLESVEKETTEFLENVIGLKQVP